MKNSILVLIAVIFATGISYVSAWTPDVAVPAVINTGTKNQIKQGQLMSDKYMASELGFFKKMLLPGNDSWLNIGGPFTVPRGTTADDTVSGITSAGGTVPLVVHLNNRAQTTKKGVNGQNAVKFISAGEQCQPNIAIVNDKASAFELVSTGNSGGNADIIARQLKLTGGQLGTNKVLAAVDTNGNAVWATMTVENGAIVIKDSNGQLISAGTSSAPASCVRPQADETANTNDIILPNQVTITGTFSTNKTFTEKYQLGLVTPDVNAFVGATVNSGSIVDSSSILFQYPSQMVPSTIKSITIDNSGVITITRTVPTLPSTTAITDVINTSFKITIPNFNKSYTIAIKDTNATGQISGYWSYHQVLRDGTVTVKTDGTTHASNMPDYSPLSITKN